MGQDMPPLPSGDIWIDHDSGGDDYFAVRHGVGTLYSVLGDTAKTSLFTTAQMMIEYSDRYVWYDANGDPVKTSLEDIEVLQDMKDAVCEQALMLLLDPDLDRRAAVMAQGVGSSRIVGEGYGAPGVGFSIAAAAHRLLSSGAIDYRDPDYNNFEIVR